MDSTIYFCPGAERWSKTIPVELVISTRRGKVKLDSRCPCAERAANGVDPAWLPLAKTCNGAEPARVPDAAKDAAVFRNSRRFVEFTLDQPCSLAGLIVNRCVPSAAPTGLKRTLRNSRYPVLSHWAKLCRRSRGFLSCRGPPKETFMLSPYWLSPVGANLKEQSEAKPAAAGGRV
jgi:hypothetical protein